MIAKLTEDGVIILTAEDGTEHYALKCWFDKHKLLTGGILLNTPAWMREKK